MPAVVAASDRAINLFRRQSEPVNRSSSTALLLFIYLSFFFLSFSISFVISLLFLFLPVLDRVASTFWKKPISDASSYHPMHNARETRVGKSQVVEKTLNQVACI